MGRFSIAALMGMVCVAAAGFAVLLSASAFWSGVLYSITLALLGVALLGALLRRGADRAFWVGFALFGLGYIYLARDEPIDPASSSGVAPRYRSGARAVRPKLATAIVLDFLEPYAPRPKYPRVGDLVDVIWGNPGTYFPASVTAVGNGQVQILWESYAPGMEEWVANGRVSAMRNELFHPTGHTLFTLLSALLGGLVGRWFRHADREAATPSQPSPTC